MSRHTEKVDGIEMSGTEIITRLARENSINPRLLLAFLEFHTNWVFGSPANPQLQYPIGFMAPSHQGLYGEISLVIRQLTLGYYGWRRGELNSLVFGDQSTLQVYPGLNPVQWQYSICFPVFTAAGLFRKNLWGAGFHLFLLEYVRGAMDPGSPI